MEWLEAGLTIIGLKLKTLIAGGFGAFISLRFFDGLNLWQRWSTFIGGWAMAAWWSETTAYWFEQQRPGAEVAFALLIGLFGMAISASMMKVVKDTDWIEVVKAIASMRFGGGGK